MGQTLKSRTTEGRSRFRFVFFFLRLGRRRLCQRAWARRARTDQSTRPQAGYNLRLGSGLLRTFARCSSSTLNDPNNKMFSAPLCYWILMSRSLASWTPASRSLAFRTPASRPPASRTPASLCRRSLGRGSLGRGSLDRGPLGRRSLSRGRPGREFPVLWVRGLGANLYLGHAGVTALTVYTLKIRN